jgi:hypothetical protein
LKRVSVGHERRLFSLKYEMRFLLESYKYQIPPRQTYLSACDRMSLTAGVRAKVHPITDHEFPEGDFQVRHPRCVEYKLKFNIKYIQYKKTHFYILLYYIRL